MHWIEHSPQVGAVEQTALIRVARLYQQAVWVAETEPALAWLLMVSAVETAANCWDRSRGAPLERLRDSKPTLVEAVEKVCPELLQTIANQIADSLGVTQKFCEFVLKFLPDPPPERPPEDYQAAWDKENMKKSLRVVYNHRSKALHEGIPFPTPMCQPPAWFSDDWPAPTEISGAGKDPFGLTNAPILLHIFEYIARHALKSWWSSLGASVE
jgi:hypothetical protein